MSKNEDLPPIPKKSNKFEKSNNQKSLPMKTTQKIIVATLLFAQALVGMV